MVTRGQAVARGLPPLPHPAIAARRDLDRSRRVDPDADQRCARRPAEHLELSLRAGGGLAVGLGVLPRAAVQRHVAPGLLHRDQYLWLVELVTLARRYGR